MTTSNFDILTGSSDSPNYPTSADYQYSFGGGGSGGNPFGGGGSGGNPFGGGSGGNPFGGGGGSGGNPFGGGASFSESDLDELFKRSPWGRLESVGITNFGQVFGGVISSGGGGNPFG